MQFTPRHLLVCLGAFGLSWLIFLSPARAHNKTLTVYKEETVSVRVEAPWPSAKPFHLKFCFSSEKEKPALSACEGETQGADEWLQRTDAWASFPLIHPTQSSFFVTGRSLTEPLPYLHLIMREQDGSTSKVWQTWTVVSPPVYAMVRLGSEFMKEPNGMSYYSINDNGTLRWINDDLARTGVRVSTRFIQIGSSDPAFSPRSFDLSVGGGYTLGESGLNHAPVEPSVTCGAEAKAGETIIARLSTKQPYLGTISWFVNGEKQQEAGEHFAYAAAKPGVSRLSVQLQTGESAVCDVTVREPAAVRIRQLIPNPEGSDVVGESLTLANNDTEQSDLAGWQLRRRDSTTVVPITTSVPAEGEMALTVSGKLVNRAATYDLYDSQGHLVDSLTHDAVKEGESLVREGLGVKHIGGVGVKAAKLSTRNQDEAQETVLVTGTILKPSGRTITLLTDSGETVRVVLHPSYTAPKPRFFQGMRLRISGSWQTSRAGRYLSVRSRHLLEIIAQPPPKKIAKKAQLSPKKTSVMTASRSSVVRPTMTQAAVIPRLRQKLELVRGPFLARFLAAGLFSFGITLVFSSGGGRRWRADSV